MLKPVTREQLDVLLSEQELGESALALILGGYKFIFGLLLMVAVSLGAPSPSLAGPGEEATRQLDLAENDLDEGRAEQAAAAAASALRLDPGLHQALVVKALAYRELGRGEEARSLLRTYLDLRGSLESDPRVRPALVFLDAEFSPLDVGTALLAAEAALEALEIDLAEAHLATVRISGAQGADLKRVLELEALASWYAGREEDAEARWRTLFERFPKATVDPDLSPDPMRAMAAIQREARGSGTPAPNEVEPAKPRLALALDSRRPTPGGFVVAGVGGGVAAFGGVLSGVSYQSGIELRPSLEADATSWSSGIDEYNSLRERERLGAAIAVAGATALIVGIVVAAVDRNTSTRRKRRGIK